MLIVEKKNDGKPFELHTTYLDQAQYYRDLSMMWLSMFLFMLLMGVVATSLTLMLLFIVFFIPYLLYQKQVLSLKRKGTMQEW